MIPYRGSVLSLLRLAEHFGLTPAAEEKEDVSLVVVESGHRKIGLVVDRLAGQQEIVIKGLQSSLKNVRGISGATILGDGKVAIIVDVASLMLESSGAKIGELNERNTAA